MTDAENKNIYNHILKYTSIFGGVQGLNILMGVVRNKIMALLLGTQGMGLLSLLNSAVNFISQSTNLGISFSAVRNLSEYYDTGDKKQIDRFIVVIRIWCLMAALLGMVVCIIIGPLLNDYSFSWGDHTMHFVLLSPAVGLLAVTGGETAILKGTRNLKALAKIQVFSVLAVLLITIPLVYFFNYKAIVPLITATALISMIITILYSYKLYPLKFGPLKGVFGEGAGMVKLGIAFVLTGIMGSGAEMVIRAFLNVESSLDIVGLYNAGYMITITYAGMVFSAMESDYYPRLAAINHDAAAVKDVANKQIEVSLLIISPMLAALIIGLPALIPLLFSGKFLPVVGMAQAAVFAMYLKAVALPIAFITLSKGDSMPYLILESFFNIMMVVCVVVGYNTCGLVGTGIGISLSYLVELIVNACFTRFRYKFSISKQVWRCITIQYPLGILAYSATFINNDILYWSVGLTIVCISSLISINILRSKTSLWNSLMRKIRRGHHEE